MDDLRPDGHAETAEFAPARVGGRPPPRLGPIVATLWVVILTGVVSLGILSHSGPTPDSSSIPSPVPAALRPMPSTHAIGRAQPGNGTPSRSGDPGPISLVI